jgi:hypothetical protein
LINTSADPAVGWQRGITPLLMACMHAKTDVVKLLLAHKADHAFMSPLADGNDSRKSCLTLAVESGWLPLVQLLAERIPSLVNVITKVRSFAEASCDMPNLVLRVQDNNAWLPVETAASLGYSRIVQYLLQSAQQPVCSVDSCTARDSPSCVLGDVSSSPLSSATPRLSKSSCCASQTFSIDYGKSALMAAAASDRLEVVKRLIYCWHADASGHRLWLVPPKGDSKSFLDAFIDVRRLLFLSNPITHQHFCLFARYRHVQPLVQLTWNVERIRRRSRAFVAASLGEEVTLHGLALALCC